MLSRLRLPLALLSAVALAACSETDEVTEPADVPGADIAEAAASGDERPAFLGGTRTYRVTVENLTTGQPFSPGVIATHRRGQRVFQLLRPASEGIRLIAESGDPSVAFSELSGAPGIFQVKRFPDPLGPIHRVGGPGSVTGSIEIEAGGDARQLSLAIMLICTNDGFTGLESVRLPIGFRPVTYVGVGFDAGTEANDESSENIVDACGAVGPVDLPADGNGRVAEGGVITPHGGIQGGADLDPELHGWKEPVAKITVERIK